MAVGQANGNISIVSLDQRKKDDELRDREFREFSYSLIAHKNEILKSNLFAGEMFCHFEHHCISV